LSPSLARKTNEPKSSPTNPCHKILNCTSPPTKDNSDPNKECLDVYREQFKTAFLHAPENYYTAESEAFLTENSACDHLKRAEGRSREKEVHVEHYLHAHARKDLVQKREHVLIGAHPELIW
jgi:cullin 1